MFTQLMRSSLRSPLNAFAVCFANKISKSNFVLNLMNLFCDFIETLHNFHTGKCVRIIFIWVERSWS
jgi:hypothetical protein